MWAEVDELQALAQGGRDPKTAIDNDLLKEYGNASHIERAVRNGKAVNGDALAVEPSKTLNPNPGYLDPETKMNVEEISMLRSDSMNSLNSGTHSGRSSRLGRIFRSKHEKDSRSRADLPRGELEMAIRYAEATRKLVVLVLKARYLLPFDKKGNCNPYITVKLLETSNGKEAAKRKTPTVKSSLNPTYDNHFEFDVTPSDLHNYRVQLQVKDDTNYGTFASRPVVGSIDIRLDQLYDRELPQQWVALQAQRK